MKKNLEKTILEMFGTPIGAYAGEPMVGVRDELNELGGVCPHCEMMVIDGKCACPSSMESHPEMLCKGCGMQADQCNCKSSGVCPKCQQMSLAIDAPCSCGLNESKFCCEVCGMSEAMCECGYMNEADLDEGPGCSECGMSEATCECGYMNETDAVKKRSYHGDEYKASAGSIEALKKHGDSKEKAVKAGAFDWAKNPYAAARAAEIVKTGKAAPTRGPKAKD